MDKSPPLKPKKKTKKRILLVEKTPSPAKVKTPSPAKVKTPSPAKVKTPSPPKVKKTIKKKKFIIIDKTPSPPTLKKKLKSENLSRNNIYLVCKSLL